MDQTEVATECVKEVEFGVMTDEEVKKLSVLNITNRNLFDNVGRPMPGGLYDPLLGPMNDYTPCKTCGLRDHHCPGHCGDIDLVAPVYHPLLFNRLVRVLQNTCLACYHFKASREEVEMCISKLKLIMKGDVSGARELDDLLFSKDTEDSDSRLHLDGSISQYGWTSFQLCEALSVLDSFMMKKRTKCHCGVKNPPITKPTFGFIYMGGLNDDSIKANIIKGHKLNELMDEGDMSMSEIENAESPSNRRRKKYDDVQLEYIKWKKPRTLLPTEVRGILERLWENEAQLCSFISDIRQHHNTSQKKSAFTMYFLKTILVPPTKFRKPSKGGELVMEHHRTVLLGKILDSNMSLAKAYEQYAETDVILSRWMNLQQSVNIHFNSKTAAGLGQTNMVSGICQTLEKKEGMFRQLMMGKRVNYACRSVISPDPYLAVNEIGIPLVFALKLTYPERVTPWNLTNLQDAILNGPEIHPGATHYADKNSNYILPNSRKSRIPFSRKLPSSRGVTTLLGKTFSNDYENKVVRRHLRNGDIVLVNRQPSLHKPSIIALTVRVLPEERTLRFHYANCDSFNADFDGDEINVHLPQDEISRAEAYNIVNANNQYIVPTRGDPKRGLIQDHIVGAVLLTKRDTFLTKEEFNQLICMSSVCSFGALSLNAKSGQKLSVLDSENVIQTYPPVIIKPKRLWTGKQVITAILNHITTGYLPFTTKKRTKIAREYFGMDESRKNKGSLKAIDEVSGKLKKIRNSKKTNVGNSAKSRQKDRWRFGKENSESGMERRMSGSSSHSIDEDVVFVYKNELIQGIIDKEQFGKYGLVHAVQELYGSNAAGNLLTALGRVLIAFLQMIHGFTCGVHDLLLVRPCDNQRKKLLDACLNCGSGVHQQFIGCEKEYIGSLEMQTGIEKAIRANGESALMLLDGMMRSKLNTLSSAVTKLFPEGLVKPFRKNALSLMTLSGAKGGSFNFQQISLFLGQQELEGKRVPRMVSGKTLPCFAPWDSSARAGGFISDRYLTGLCPQEFYFHCMAGREGLVDTAVKTSRSGYLQRCLIKNLECLSVNYDYTVRDADGSIIQFRYGEDGVDVHKMNYMREFEALALNQQLIVSRNPLGENDDECISKYVEEDNEVPNQLAKEAKEFLKNHASAVNSRHTHPKDCSSFMKLVKNKYYMSLAHPGDPVGIIAAQSIGEPSTQMTLNTFHHAGRGEMNVTLGIPRLLEILKDASKTIRTPTITCPLLKCKTKDDAERLAAKLKRITVADLIENMEVTVMPFAIKEHEICSIYKLNLKLYDPQLYPRHTDITLEDCQNTLLGEYLKKMEAAISSHLLLVSRISGIKSESKPIDGSNEMRKDGFESSESQTEEVEDSDNEKVDDSISSKARKRKGQAADEMDYEDNESEEEVEEEVELNEQDVLEDSSGPEQKEKSEATQQKTSDKERAIHVACDGLCFEVHFKLTNEPHILLAKIAEKTAEKVYVKNAGKIENCKAVELHLDDSGNEGFPMLIRKGINSRPALQTAGVDFVTYWNMQDEVDVRFISSNDIQAMLDTYGVEAARATLITEIYTVFGHYGVTVDMRHLTLIADYMTHTGKYRPLNRYGGLAESISPFSKIAFETAANFITQAAVQGEVDNLQTPTARICLGLPAKLGTGCFDLNQYLNVY